MTHNWTEKTIENNGDVWDREEPIEGKLVNIEHNVGPSESTMYTLEKDDNTQLKFWGSTVLNDKLLGVPVGTYIKVSYEGKKQSKSGARQYHDFKVFVDLDSIPQASPDEVPMSDIPPNFLRPDEDLT